MVTSNAPGLSFPRDTFAKLSPRPFLHAHLQAPASVRPNGRQLDEFRAPTINTGSLTHSNGSAVVRVGDTAVVCGVRGEVLLASDIPHRASSGTENDTIEELGLIVPNLELSTGCSPVHLPGNPPSSMAQSLSYRINTILSDNNVIDIASLRIDHALPTTDDDLPDEGERIVTKAFWVLYVDILCLALDGNALDAAWLAVSAALRDTVLPRAWWDSDTESVLCSPLKSEAVKVKLGDLPVLSSFAVFTTASPLKGNDGAQSWIIADPDAFEEEACDETLTVMLSSVATEAQQILTIERSGGCFVDKAMMRACLEKASQHRTAVIATLQN